VYALLAAGIKGGKKMLLLRRIEHVLGIPTPQAEFQPAGLLLASLMLAAGFVWVAGSGRPLMAEVGDGATQERLVQREAGLAELPESRDAKATDDERGERKKAPVGGLVSPEEKREFNRQRQEWAKRIGDLTAAGQLEEARAAEEELRRQVQEMAERGWAVGDQWDLSLALRRHLLQEMAERGGDRPFPRQEEVLQRNRRIQQQLEEARQAGQIDVVERLERALEEVKRRARPVADPVRGKLAELYQRMHVAIRRGRPDEVIELGHQIAEVMHSSSRDQPAHPDDDPFRPRPSARRPDDVARPDGPTPRGRARSRPDGPGPAAPQELLEVVRQLREEVGQLRREVNELRGERGEERR
jgi:hypothetical protein